MSWRQTDEFYSSPELLPTPYSPSVAYAGAKGYSFDLALPAARADVAANGHLGPNMPGSHSTAFDELDEPDGDGGAIRIYCAHPSCAKHYASQDGVRKHAKRYHPDWLHALDQDKQRCGTPTPPEERADPLQPHGGAGRRATKRRRTRVRAGEWAAADARRPSSASQSPRGSEDVVGEFASMLSAPIALPPALSGEDGGDGGGVDVLDSPGSPCPLSPMFLPAASLEPDAALGCASAPNPPAASPPPTPAELEAQLHAVRAHFGQQQLELLQQHQFQHQHFGACGPLPWPTAEALGLAYGACGAPPAAGACGLGGFPTGAVDAAFNWSQVAAAYQQAYCSSLLAFGAGPAFLISTARGDAGGARGGAPLLAGACAPTSAGSDARGDDESLEGSARSGAFHTPEGTPAHGRGAGAGIELSALRCEPAGEAASAGTTCRLLDTFAEGELERLFDDALRQRGEVWGGGWCCAPERAAEEGGWREGQEAEAPSEAEARAEEELAQAAADEEEAIRAEAAAAEAAEAAAVAQAAAEAEAHELTVDEAEVQTELGLHVQANA